MAILEFWSVPNALSSAQGPFLKGLTPEKKGVVFYTMYQPDLIGELDVNNNNVREWVIPWKGLPDAHVGSIKYGPGGLPWFALTGASKVVQFDPTSNTFTAYFLNACPADFMFDSQGNIWFTGLLPPDVAPEREVIGRLNLSDPHIQYWALPNLTKGNNIVQGFAPSTIWVDSQDTVWCSNGNSSQLTPGPSFAHLSQNQVTFVFLQPGPLASPYPGIVVDPLVQNVWITNPGGGIPQIIWKYDIITNQSSAFSNPNFPSNSLMPSHILLDGQNNAWFSDWQGGIGVINADAGCGTRFSALTETYSVSPQSAGVLIEKKQVKPVKSHSEVIKTKIDPQGIECYQEFRFNPGQQKIQPTGSLAMNPHAIWFCACGDLVNRIGCLYL